jgi:hypothetical protein
MDLNKAVPPWRRKSWRKRYSNTMKMHNQAKLAAGAAPAATHFFFQFHPLEISPTCRFHQFSDFTQFHPTILSPQSPAGSAEFLPISIVPTVADFTNLQISPSFTFVRFHELANFTNFQISPSFT